MVNLDRRNKLGSLQKANGRPQTSSMWHVEDEREFDPKSHGIDGRVRRPLPDDDKNKVNELYNCNLETLEIFDVNKDDSTILDGSKMVWKP